MKKFKITIYLLFFYLLTISFQNNVTQTAGVFSLNDTCQFSAEIDGKEISFIDGNENIRNGSNVIKTFKKLPDSSTVIFQSYFYKYPAGQADVSVNLGTLHFVGHKIKQNDFIDFFKADKYNFSVLAENGVEVIYYDKKFQLWSSSQGNQDQSKFEITELISDSVNVKFKAILNCKLYNSEGKFKILEKGIFVGYFRNK